MVNAWSLLFDKLNMTEHSKYYYDFDRNRDPFGNTNTDEDNSQDFWEFDGIDMTGNPGPYAADTVPIVLGGVGKDTLNFSGSGLPGGMGEDHINLSIPDFPTTRNPNFRKYNEDEIIKELSDYITRTYSSHYSAGSEKIQTLDLIEACGDGESFCRSNILKYASRYDKKGTARRDIMKILHYAVLLMYFNDKNSKKETYNQ